MYSLFINNSSAAKTLLNSNISNALSSIASENSNAIYHIFSNPNFYNLNNDIIDSGRLLNSISYSLDPVSNKLFLGSNSNYALQIHEGSHLIPPRPFLKDSILAFRNVYLSIAADTLKNGFN